MIYELKADIYIYMRLQYSLLKITIDNDLLLTIKFLIHSIKLNKV